MLTIDASVLVAAAIRDEPAHEAAADALRLVTGAGLAVHQPAIAVVEVTSAAARRTGDGAFARRLGQAVLAMPGLVVHGLDADAALMAAALASDLRLRAADAVYAATALALGTTLITLDAELVDRAGSIVAVLTPSDWIAQQLASLASGGEE